MDIPDEDGTGTQEIRALTYPATITADGRGTFASVTIPNQAEPPTPTGGGTMFVQDGALKFIGSGGTVTEIAPA